MYYLLGTILIVGSAVLALLASVSYAMTIRGNRLALIYARVGVTGSFFMVVAIWLIMAGLFLARRFDIDYVYSYSSTELNTYYTLAATWAGQPGSLAIWAVFGGVVSMLILRRSRHFEPYVLGILMLVQAVILGLMLISNPFAPLTDPSTGLVVAEIPQDGQGLNPLLYNFWMLSHPPVLFIGYALAAVPFAFALGGLLRYDYDGWVTRALPWTLAAWVFLGLALLLGGYWAYETLGWGGYWGWDPVENSSLVPWLLLSALLHSMLVQRTHGSLRRTNIILAILTFLFVFYATFLTRSGVLSNFSVHSFVAEGLREAMIAVMLLLIVGSVVLTVMRWKDIPSRPLSSAFFSRDTFMVLTVLTLAVMSLVIILGTSMPVISAIPGVGHSLQEFLGTAFEIDDGTALGGEPLEDGRFSLMPSFYSSTVPPLGIVLMLLLIVGPLTTWREGDVQSILLKGLRIPFIAAVVGAILAILFGVRDLLGLGFVALSIFAAGTNIATLRRNARMSWLHTGGQVAHLGLCILIVGIVGSSLYASPDERVVMSTGDTVSIYGYDITLNGWEATKDKEGNPDGRGVLDMTVQRGGSTFNARPELYFDRTMGGTMQSPAIKSYFWRDMYISPVEYIREIDPNKPMLQTNQTEEVGPYAITFDGFEIDEHSFQETGEAEIGARLNVEYEGETYQVLPRINLVPDEEQVQQNENGETMPFVEIPDELPGGHEVALTMLDPSQQMVFLEIEGLGLPVTPGRAVITVSMKPLVILVWVGSIVGIIGGGIALLRRRLEGSMLLRERKASLPQGLEQV